MLDVMIVSKLRYYLNSICNHGNTDMTLHFLDENDDWQTIESIYIDSDGDLVLDSSGDGDYYGRGGTLLHALGDYDGDLDVYVRDSDGDYYSIDWGWYIDDGDLYMDIEYCECDGYDYW